MAGETIAFAEAYDTAFIMRHELESALGQPVPMLMLTDSEALFNVITRARYTSESRLMVDIAAAREGYNDGTITNVGLIASDDNPADGLTKIRSNDALRQLLHTHRLRHPVKRYVVSARVSSPQQRSDTPAYHCVFLTSVRAPLCFAADWIAFDFNPAMC